MKGHATARDVSVALLVRFETQPGKEQEVITFLRDALALVQREPDMVRWFAVRFGSTSFGIFDAFPDAAGRQAHLDGRVAAALQSAVGPLIQQPTFEHVDVLVERPPV